MPEIVFDKVTRPPIEADGMTIDGVRLVISQDDVPGGDFLISALCGADHTTLTIPKEAVLAMAEKLKG